MYTLKLIVVPKFSFLGWFSFSSTVISCWQLFTTDDNWYEKKIDWNFYEHTKFDTCAKFQLSKLIFIFINCHQQSTAVLTADDSIYEKKITGIFMYTLKLILVPNFSSLNWFSFSSTVISCHRLLSAVDSWWQQIWKKFDWNFYEHAKVDTCAEFQLSRIIFIFVSFWQLLSAVDNWWQLSQKIWVEITSTT